MNPFPGRSQGYPRANDIPYSQGYQPRAQPFVVPSGSNPSSYQQLALMAPEREGPSSRYGRGMMPRPEEMGVMMFDPREEHGAMIGFGKMDMHPMIDPFEMINDVLAEFSNMIGGGMMMPGGPRGPGGPMGFGMIMGGFMDPEAMQMMMMNGEGLSGGGMMVIQSGGMGPEQSYTQSFMSSTQIGPDGKPIEERYYSKKLDAVGPDGKRIVEKKEAFKSDLTGEEKVYQEERLDDKGRRLIREKSSKDDELKEQVDYKNIAEGEEHHFENNFKQYKRAVSGNTIDLNTAGTAQPERIYKPSALENIPEVKPEPQVYKPREDPKSTAFASEAFPRPDSRMNPSSEAFLKADIPKTREIPISRDIPAYIPESRNRDYRDIPYQSRPYQGIPERSPYEPRVYSERSYLDRPIQDPRVFPSMQPPVYQTQYYDPVGAAPRLAAHDRFAVPRTQFAQVDPLSQVRIDPQPGFAYGGARPATGPTYPSYGSSGYPGAYGRGGYRF